MRGKTRTRSGVKKKRRRNNGNVNEIVRENEHRFYAKRQNPTRSTFQFSPSRAEPSRAVQTLMLKFTSPINPSFRSMHLDSVYLLDQESVVAPSDISIMNVSLNRCFDFIRVAPIFSAIKKTRPIYRSTFVGAGVNGSSDDDRIASTRKL